jgi:hypothetical protein
VDTLHGIAMDITERKRVETEINMLNTSLRRKLPVWKTQIVSWRLSITRLPTICANHWLLSAVAVR